MKQSKNLFKGWMPVTFLAIIMGSALFMPEKTKITVWLCGDSTMSIKETKAYPETGWGMPFSYFFDSTVTIKNLAKMDVAPKHLSAKNYGRK